MRSAHVVVVVAGGPADAAQPPMQMGARSASATRDVVARSTTTPEGANRL